MIPAADAPAAAADGARRPGRPGRAGLVAIAVSIAGTVAVGAAGPSLMEPPLPGAPGSGQPGPAWLPWSADLSLGPYLAVGLAAASLAAGALGLLLTLRAIRAGWLVSPRYVLLAGVLAALVAGTTRPFGTSDFLSYAAYGHELVTGHNPYLVAPRALPGDPVARAAQDWSGTPSVYGALATGVFGAAALIGGTSARLTVFVLDLVNAAAFVVTGALLYRLARGQAARLRAALLWTCNPLLLQVLVAGSHVDALAVAFSIGGLAILFPLIPNVPSRLSTHSDLSSLPSRRGVLRGAVAGVLLGLGFAVKPTVLLVATGLAVGVAAGFRPAARQSRSAPRPARGSGILMAPMRAISTPDSARTRILAGLFAGFMVMAGVDAALIGRAGIAQTTRASDMVSVGSPWRVVRTVLSQFVAEPVADEAVRWCAVALAVFLAAALLRRLGAFGAGGGAGAPAVCAFALVLAWLLAWPYVLPWYDAMAWALLALLPASRFDWLLLARTVVLAFGYLPARATGIVIPGGLRWMEPVLRSAVTPVVLAALLVVLLYRLAPPVSRKDVGTADAGDGARPAPLTGSDHL